MKLLYEIRPNKKTQTDLEISQFDCSFTNKIDALRYAYDISISREFLLTVHITEETSKDGNFYFNHLGTNEEIIKRSEIKNLEKLETT